LRAAIVWHCYDPADDFFYDRTPTDTFRKYRTCHITFLLSEAVPERAVADRIYQRYLKHPREFWTPYPFPSVSISDPSFERGIRAHANSWGGWTNSPMLYRLSRWMDRDGHTDDLLHVMATWVEAMLREDEPTFRQGVHPVTGAQCAAAPGHGNSLLFFVEAVQRLGAAAPTA
jgi:hypothetical protein